MTGDGPPLDTPQALALRRQPRANVARYECLRAQITGGCLRHEPAAGDVVMMLRRPKMFGMAQAVTDLIEQGRQLLKYEEGQQMIRGIICPTTS